MLLKIDNYLYFLTTFTCFSLFILRIYYFVICSTSNFLKMSNLKMHFRSSSIIHLIIAICMLFPLYGCYKVRFYHDTDILREKYDGNASSISSIVIGSQINGPMQIRSVCPSGASLTEIEQTMWDGLSHYLSLGLYSPNTIRIWCKRRKR